MTLFQRLDSNFESKKAQKDENADLHYAVLNKTMTTQEQCIKYDFLAPLNYN